MARKTNPQPLTLTDPRNAKALPPAGGLEPECDSFDNYTRAPLTPSSAKSPKSPRSPFRFSSKKGPTPGEQPLMQAAEQLRSSATAPSQNVSLPPLELPSTEPAEEKYEQKHEEKEKQLKKRAPRGGFFSHYKASKSSARLQKSDAVKSTAEGSMSRDTDRPGKVSSPEASRTDSSSEKATRRKPVGGPSNSEVSIDSTSDTPPPSTSNTAKKNKPKPFSLLSRNRSLRDDKNPRGASHSHTDNTQEQREPLHKYSNSVQVPLRLESDRPSTSKDKMNSNVRQHSQDRQANSRARDVSREKAPRESSKLQPSLMKEPARENNRNPAFSSNGGGHGFLNNLKSSATKGAGALHKGLFGGKGGRTSSTTEKEIPVDDEHYELKVINKPLIEQTRLTRISKRLEDSRDKTEFWMPAFPWRAIDYLNYKGSEVEGLYRVPGSGPQIKKWQRKFDEELDIDLFGQVDLYDINIIGSMLKAWLRELPEELFPKTAQDRIARECGGSNTVPQQLVDELSNLSPFNYYLLFAITCHLSLLLAHSEKNKMDFRNLCICFQPCMKIDAFCFKFLVCDWRDCWKGCKTEAFYTEQEYILFDMIPPGSAEGQSSAAMESHDERNVSSSDSSKPSSVSVDSQGKMAFGGKTSHTVPLTQSESHGSISTVSTTLTVVQERTPPGRSTEMRPLSPIKPLSPIGF